MLKMKRVQTHAVPAEVITPPLRIVQRTPQSKPTWSCASRASKCTQ